MRVWSPTSPMAATRFVCLNAAITGHPPRSVDLASAYIQAELEGGEGGWYALLDATAVEGLTDPEKAM